MKFIIRYKLFESEIKLFRDMPTSEYTKMVRKPDIACFDEKDIKVLSDFFKKNNIKYQFKDASLLPLPPLDWVIVGDNDIDIHIDIEEKPINAHLTDGSVKSFDLRDYIGLSYKEIDALSEIKENWFTLHNFSLVIPKDPIPIVILKCYCEYYIVDMGERSGKSYLCDQIDGLISCLSNINIQNEEYKHMEYLYTRVNADDMIEAMNRDVEIPKYEMDIINNLECDGKKFDIDEGITPEKSMQIYSEVDNKYFQAECLLISILDIQLGGRGDEKTVMEVLRTDDEYYMVNVTFYGWYGSWRMNVLDDPEYYKCDSIEGLIQLIEEVMKW